MNWYKRASSVSISIDKWQQVMREWLLDFISSEEIEQYMPELISGTQINMQGIANNIQQAISSIPTWNNTPVNVEARTPERENEIGPEEDAQVSVGTVESSPWGGAASFTYFNTGGQVHIEDVLSGGDVDFFSESNIEQDYFSLVQELKSPGISASSGKVLTLYTARPVSDRDQYLDNASIPHGIYLTNRFDRAVGIAMDLGGSSGERDIWQVRVNERYLMQTLDSMGQNDYQAVGKEIPVESISLVQEGNSHR